MSCDTTRTVHASLSVTVRSGEQDFLFNLYFYYALAELTES